MEQVGGPGEEDEAEEVAEEGAAQDQAAEPRSPRGRRAGAATRAPGLGGPHGALGPASDALRIRCRRPSEVRGAWRSQRRGRGSRTRTGDEPASEARRKFNR